MVRARPCAVAAAAPRWVCLAPHPEAEAQGAGCPCTLTRHSASSRGAFLTRQGVCLESGVPEEDRTLTARLSGRPAVSQRVTVLSGEQNWATCRGMGDQQGSLRR